MITTLPTFEVNISDKRLMVLWKFFRNFPLPTSTSIGALGEDVLDGAMLTSVSLVCSCFLGSSRQSRAKIKEGYLMMIRG